ncbi:MAG: aspartyl/asparaginyl beta-hydroxylase domain-containing protein [Proteobacteria bacterium]|jgi:aspartate beta-hydroxylase|nr:aspartyl/asparaginyl beta-hydroxylase domain-containing protein [Pseudomonadota bacterium]
MENLDLPSKIIYLEKWCVEKGMVKDDIKKVFEMLELGKRQERNANSPIQYPAFYINDSMSRAWHDPQYPWIKTLEDNFYNIRDEALKIFEDNLMGIHPENDDLAGNGTWNTFFFYKNGTKYEQNHELCPFTSSILSQISGVNIAGRTYFSAMTPGIHIKPHCGPHNFKLRTHLGIIAPEAAVIRVGDMTRSWPEGKCIVFDDSFEHEVWNHSTGIRIVLIVDVWNPSLTLAETQALEYIMPEFYKG